MGHAKRQVWRLSKGKHHFEDILPNMKHGVLQLHGEGNQEELDCRKCRKGIEEKLLKVGRKIWIWSEVSLYGRRKTVRASMDPLSIFMRLEWSSQSSAINPIVNSDKTWKLMVADVLRPIWLKFCYRNKTGQNWKQRIDPWWLHRKACESFIHTKKSWTMYIHLLSTNLMWFVK